LFFPVIIFVFTPIGIDYINNKINYKKVKRMEISFFLIMIIYLSINCFRYTGDKMYYNEEEINPLISYIQENIKEDEKLYVYPSAREAFLFKNGYNSTKIGNVSQDNIIYGKNRMEWNESSIGNELWSILENQKIYLIFQHHRARNININNALSVLKNYGTLTEIMNIYDTPLYFFELDKSKDREW
jgi:hypothetical protein